MTPLEFIIKNLRFRFSFVSISSLSEYVLNTVDPVYSERVGAAKSVH